PGTPVVPPPAAAAVQAPSEARVPAVEPAAGLVGHPRVRGRGGFALLMTLLGAALGGLRAAGGVAPGRGSPPLPPGRRARHLGGAPPRASPPRRPAPPGSQFDE